MRVVELRDGLVILGTFPDREVLDVIQSALPGGKTGLCIADPPYGNIVDDKWDLIATDDKRFSEWMFAWTRVLGTLMLEQGALYVWGGIGKPGFRPFYRYAADVEHETEYVLSNHITWSKRRAYGTAHNYLFTREELLYLVKGDPKKPRVFNVPLLSTKRGYAGYDLKYPAKSEFYRRTNVWTDITELFRGKVHTAQKPERLHEILIETHTMPGEWVLDPFSGSATTALAAINLGRKFVLVEKDPKSFELGVRRVEAHLEARSARGA